MVYLLIVSCLIGGLTLCCSIVVDYEFEGIAKSASHQDLVYVISKSSVV
jgi:hypothetical protein